MKLSNLKRNPDAVRASLVTKANGSVVCKEDCSFYMPKKLLGSLLLQVDADPYVVGGFGMLVVGNNYMVFNVCALMTLGPAVMAKSTVNGIDCLEFKFDKFDVVIENLTVPVMNTLGYNITKEMSKKASIPPWYEENDIIGIPLTLPEFTRTSIPPLPYVNIYMSYLMRDSTNPRIPYRLTDRKVPLRMLPLNAVGITVPNTLNAYGGSYIDDAMQGKLVHMSERTSPLEEVLT